MFVFKQETEDKYVQSDVITIFKFFYLYLITKVLQLYYLSKNKIYSCNS